MRTLKKDQHLTRESKWHSSICVGTKNKRFWSKITVDFLQRKNILLVTWLYQSRIYLLYCMYWFPLIGIYSFLMFRKKEESWRVSRSLGSFGTWFVSLWLIAWHDWFDDLPTYLPIIWPFDHYLIIYPWFTHLPMICPFAHDLPICLWFTHP